MISIAALGPEGSLSWQAARLYRPDARVLLHNRLDTLLVAVDTGETDLAVVPVFNTRAGEIKESLRGLSQLRRAQWTDNVIVPITLSLGTIDSSSELRVLLAQEWVFRQCEEYIAAAFPGITLITTNDPRATIAAIIEGNRTDQGVIDSEESLLGLGLVIRERELAPHNKTRFAVVGATLPARSGYDATALITMPLKDRVGLLYDILGEFARRGVNLLDMRSDADVISQKLSFYFEAEGHVGDEALRSAIERIESHVIQEAGSITVLGSYPRLDMRTKLIHTIGFIGTGEMSKWFAAKLENEGYRTILTGRSSTIQPEAMVRDVEAVVICVPISAIAEATMRYGRLLSRGQALILLVGEAESALKTALAQTDEGVEVMLVHNLWGPQAATMKDKNVAVVRTSRSGPLCSEFESFLYKHGAIISKDTSRQHDLMMGVTQKLPTLISVALAMALGDNDISPAEIRTHSTLTSLYTILAMARIHSQRPQTYAEIMATKGEGQKIARDFARNLSRVMDLADEGKIDALCELISENRELLTEEFLAANMAQALTVDEILGKRPRV